MPLRPISRGRARRANTASGSRGCGSNAPRTSAAEARRGDRVMTAAAPTIAYADGSCVGNPGPGGWGVVIVAPDGTETELSGWESRTTNNRMEITAALEALRHLEP